MKIEYFTNLVDSGFDVRMHYNDKEYWAAWDGTKKGKKAFYEAYKDDIISFEKAEEILDKNYNGFKIRDMIEALTDDDVYY